MNVKDIIELKEKENMAEEEISELSGIPLDIVKKIFSGEINNPKYLTLMVLEQVLVKKEKVPFSYDEADGQPCLLREQVAYNFNARKYDVKDLEQLYVGIRLELIDNKIYALNTPNRMHQFLITKLLVKIVNHIDKNNGKCHAYTSNLGVRLFADDSTWVIPDILVACKKEILTDQGCDGAPDFVIEVVSPSNAFHDYVTKAYIYQEAGVREYWIVDPRVNQVTVFDFETSTDNKEYTYSDTIKSSVLNGFEVRIDDFIKDYNI